MTLGVTQVDVEADKVSGDPKTDLVAVGPLDKDLKVEAEAVLDLK